MRQILILIEGAAKLVLSPGGLVGRSVSSFRGGGLSSLVGGFGGVVENHLYCELVALCADFGLL